MSHTNDRERLLTGAMREVLRDAIAGLRWDGDMPRAVEILHAAGFKAVEINALADEAIRGSHAHSFGGYAGLGIS